MRDQRVCYGVGELGEEQQSPGELGEVMKRDQVEGQRGKKRAKGIAFSRVRLFVSCILIFGNERERGVGKRDD